MKPWLRLVLLAIVCLVLAFTSRYWFNPILAALDANTDRIQGVDAFLNLLLVGVSLLSAYLGWQRRKEEAAVKTEIHTVAGATVIADGGKKGDVVHETHYHVTANPADLLPRQRLTPDLRHATETYLRHVVDRYRYLAFRGMGMSDRVPLKLELLKMYVSLKARAQHAEGEARAQQQRLAGRRLTEEEAEVIGQRLGEPQPLLELLRQHPGLIILGDPGAGKTTFLKWLALHLALGRGAELNLPHRLPILLPLSAYANALAREKIPLERFIARYYEQERGIVSDLGAMLTEALAAGNALLLLDGLDEVHQLGQRQDVVNRVVDFFTVQRRRGNKFILTSRIVGYPEVRPVVEGLFECTLLDFDHDDITLFVEKWTAAIEALAQGESAVAVQKGEQEKRELLQAVSHNPGVARLATNPLLLTVLALMKRQGVELPEKRAELYAHYIKVLLRQWNLARSVDDTPSYAPDVNQVLRLLVPLAYWMQQTSPGVGLVQEHDLRRELQRLLAERQEPEPEQVAYRFLADVRDHASLLQERGSQQYGFIHLTFQEYLAGAFIAGQAQYGAERVAQLLLSHLDDDNWHEASLLALGHLGIVQPWPVVVGQVLDKLLGARRVEGVLLAGEGLLDMGAAVVVPAVQQRVVGALQKVMVGRKVPPRQRLRAGLALADLGDEVPGVDDWVAAPGWGFRVGRYPVTNGQFARFMAAGGYAAENEARWWDAEGLQYKRSSNWQEPRWWDDNRFNHRTQPVVGVSWYEANAYCGWLTGRLRQEGVITAGEAVRLPTVAEWELVAGGVAKRPYPWSDTFDPTCANTEESGLNQTTPVHLYPAGQTPEGVWDLAGNVWEWTNEKEDGNWYYLSGGGFWNDGKSVGAAVRPGTAPPALQVQLLRFSGRGRPHLSRLVLVSEFWFLDSDFWYTGFRLCHWEYGCFEYG